MKRYNVFASLLATAFALTACNEDFTDWAAPQTNPQEDPAAAVVATIEAATPEISKETSPDTVALLRLVSATNAQAGSNVKFTSIKVNGNALPVITADSTVYVTTAALDSVTQVIFNSKMHTSRDLLISTEGAMVAPSGQAVSFSANDVDVKYTPGSTPAEESAYYLVGDFNNWTLTTAGATALESKGDGIFEKEIETTADGQKFKIFGQAALEAASWDGALGAATDGDESEDGFLCWTTTKQPGAIMIAKAGKVKITVDVRNFRYSVKTVVDALYMTGSAYNWGGSEADWHALTPVYGEAGAFWKIIYAEAGEQIKFAPQQGWGGDFAGTVSTDAAGSGAAPEGGNLKFANAGWYLIYVSSTTQTVEVYSPEVYMMGDCIGGWEVTPAGKFTIPTTPDGEFVSPAFVADGEMRVCVHPKDAIDWWKMEFILIDGNIVYRGNGGDQERVKASAGQQLHLNFKTNTGSVK